VRGSALTNPAQSVPLSGHKPDVTTLTKEVFPKSGFFLLRLVFSDFIWYPFASKKN
jgi:hypothetical protein